MMQEIAAITDYIALFAKDGRLTVWHLAMLVAILHLKTIQNTNGPILISRKKIMLFSHVQTSPTYHKYLKELQVFGYIKYTPSYHPGFGSEVELLV
ncbi:hypothetical protein [Mucilaginibacter paludis]|uniref:Uncharacterized protein n=1 Tax=Mucilaginibacter paludis DSM 18603 TaxID=714943 RepID=H1YAF8_9SPHI|nr:hypothetical protein [Mucilaginibacter paludis]EHQ27001.1 hypothetical protein Mucpa_2892 [Mucilaginibacter paludis DSM 18603]